MTSVENNLNFTVSNITEFQKIQETTLSMFSYLFEEEKVDLELTTFEIEANSSKASSENSMFNIFIVLLIFSIIIIIIFTILLQVYGRRRYYLKFQSIS
jgi:cell division protein FtsX